MSVLSRRWWMLAALLRWTLCCAQTAAPTSPTPPSETTLVRVSQIRALSEDEAGRGYAARLTGVVTFSDGDAGLLFVQDDSGGIYVAPQTAGTIPAGTRVEVQGIVQPGSHLPFVAKAVVLDRGVTSFPKSRAVTFGQLATGQEDSNWIEAEGVVRSVQIGAAQGRLVLTADGQRILVRVAEPGESLHDMTEWMDARVRLRGVAGAPAATSTEGPLLQVHVPHPRFLELRVRAIPALQSPLRTTGWLREHYPTNTFVHRVRLRGVLERQTNGSVRLRDETGWIELSLTSPTLGAMTNTTVEVVGFPEGGAGSPRLEDARVSLLSRAASTSPGAATTATTPDEQFLPVLEEVEQVRRLSAQEAARGYPVRVRAVVTFLHRFEDGSHRFFVQDGTAGIYVWADTVEAACRAGSVVELEGNSNPGEYAPVIRSTKLTILGDAPLPAARPASIEELLTGRKDSQRVRVRGSIVRAQASEGIAEITLLVGGSLVDVLAAEIPRDLSVERLVDATVRVDGVCATSFNTKRQLLGVSLNVARWEDFQIIQSPPENPFAGPLRSIRSLTQFDLADDELRRRVCVRGVVTLHTPGWGLFLQDETEGLFVPSERTEPLRLGDVVEVIGFPQPGRPGAGLIEPRFRRVSAGADPQPQRVTEQELAAGDVNNRLVTLEGRLLERRTRTNNTILLCQADNLIFDAVESTQAAPTVWRSVPVGSRVQLRGVWALPPDVAPQAQMGRLWLRSPDDVKVLERPPWWTPRRVKTLGGGVLVVMLATLAWIGLLRREVRERTAESQKALALLEASIAQSPAGMLIADAPDVTIRWANSGVLGIRGSATEPMTEMEAHQRNPHWQILKPDGTVYPSTESPLSRAVRRGETTRNEELIVRGTDGETRWVLANASPIRDAAGKIMAGIVVYHEITEQKRAEEERVRLQNQLLQAQKMESVGRLAGGVAHDFNNMLQAILGNAALAALEPALPPETREHLVEIKKAAERSADLTRQLLAFARKQPVHPKVLDLNDTVAGMLKMLQRLLGENIQLAWLPGSDLWPVKMDPSQVDQMLANLTINARDAIAGVGRITIHTANIRADDTPLRINAEAAAGDYVLLSVTDSGCGMDTETQSHLFEPFFTTKAVGKGTGLGLATVYGIAKQNGGFIEVQSEPGRGSTFRIFLPRATAVPEAIAAPAAQDAWRGTETVLLVEDERQVMELSQRILRQHGYEVLATTSPEEAIRLAQAHPGPIHLLVTDVIMPGMNGRELSARLMALKPGLKCLFMSGYTADVITRQGVLEEGVQFLQKPFTIADLIQRVRETLGTA